MTSHSRSIIAIGSNVLLLVIPFAAVVEPLFAVLALLAGVAWSFGFTTLAIGHLNLLSAVFTSVLAGIGINFPIHLMARYDEGRRQGLQLRPRRWNWRWSTREPGFSLRPVSWRSPS